MIKPTQTLVEATFSQKNAHLILHESINEQLEKSLLNWTLYSVFKINEYLDKEYYESKAKRVEELKEVIAKEGINKLLIATVASVIKIGSDKDCNIQQCVGYLQAFMPHEEHLDRAKTASELLSLCSSNKGLFSIVRPDSEASPKVKINHWAAIERIFGNSIDWVNTTFFSPPLIEPPKPVTNNTNCGYHTIKEPLILGKSTMHSLPVNYRVINQLNSIEWVLEQDVMAEQELPPATSTTQDELNFIKHIKQAGYIYKLLGKARFWLAWQYDSRGRVYSHGHHVNLQSHEYKKAMLSFNKFEYLT